MSCDIRAQRPDPLGTHPSGGQSRRSGLAPDGLHCVTSPSGFRFSRTLSPRRLSRLAQTDRRIGPRSSETSNVLADRQWFSPAVSISVPGGGSCPIDSALRDSHLSLTIEPPVCDTWSAVASSYSSAQSAKAYCPTVVIPTDNISSWSVSVLRPRPSVTSAAKR